MDLSFDRRPVTTHEKAVPRPAVRKNRTNLRKAASDGSVTLSGATEISYDTRPKPVEKSTAAISEQVHEPYRSKIHPMTAATGYCPAIALHAKS